MRWLMAAIAVAVVACSNPGKDHVDTSCTFGQTRSCACTDGGVGYQQCYSSGSFEACNCAGPPAADAAARLDAFGEVCDQHAIAQCAALQHLLDKNGAIATARCLLLKGGYRCSFDCSNATLVDGGEYDNSIAQQTCIEVDGKCDAYPGYEKGMCQPK